MFSRSRIVFAVIFRNNTITQKYSNFVPKQKHIGSKYGRDQREILKTAIQGIRDERNNDKSQINSEPGEALNTQTLKRFGSKYGRDQMEILQTAIQENRDDWDNIKTEIFCEPGAAVTEKNFDGVTLKILANSCKFELANSYVNYLKKSNKELSLGAINGLLWLYHKQSLEKKLDDDEKQFILETHKYLYDKYKILDFKTCENLIHALCAIDEYEKASKILKDVYMTSTPSHSTYSTLIVSYFKNDKVTPALKLVQESLSHDRPLQDIAYEAWITYILRKYKQNKTRVKHLEEIFSHLSENFVVISEELASKFYSLFSSLGWECENTKLVKEVGNCMSCKNSIQLLKLSKEEFSSLQNNVKEKLIVGSNLFLKSSPKELERFNKFLAETAPYDIVLDALNIAFTVGKSYSVVNKADMLIKTVNYFKQENKKILVLGRKHMLNWPRRQMEQVMRDTCSFFIDDLSQDDPYFITAAILSGPHTDIVSKDLFRGHKYRLNDPKLMNLFQRWQWQHQWTVIASYKGPIIKPPLKVTPCAQKTGQGWHLPYEREDYDNAGAIHDGVPEWSSWLCLHPKS